MASFSVSVISVTGSMKFFSSDATTGGRKCGFTQPDPSYVVSTMNTLWRNHMIFLIYTQPVTSTL